MANEFHSLDMNFNNDHSNFTNFGRIYDPDENARIIAQLPFQNVYEANPDLKDTSDDTEVFLWEAELAVTGATEPRDPHNQTIGDCTSQGTGGALEDLQYVRIGWRGEGEEFHPISTETLYGNARIDIGGGRIFGDGAVTAWLFQAAQKEGFLARGRYTDPSSNNVLDLTNYSGQLAKQMGSKGVPKWLKDYMIKHLLQTFAQVHDADQACDLMRHGYPVVIGSNQGFTTTRDENGFCQPSGHWNHCTYWRGYSKISNKRQGAVYQQSWGPNMPSGNRNIITPGGKQITLPKGAFFVDMKTFDNMIKQGDAWAPSDIMGFAALDYKMW